MVQFAIAIQWYSQGKFGVSMYFVNHAQIINVLLYKKEKNIRFTVWER